MLYKGAVPKLEPERSCLSHSRRTVMSCLSTYLLLKFEASPVLTTIPFTVPIIGLGVMSHAFQVEHKRQLKVALSMLIFSTTFSSGQIKQDLTNLNYPEYPG